MGYIEQLEEQNEALREKLAQSEYRNLRLQYQLDAKAFIDYQETKFKIHKHFYNMNFYDILKSALENYEINKSPFERIVPLDTIVKIVGFKDE